jgi:hypothetical protein
VARKPPTHEGATVLVVVNSLRLLRFTDAESEPVDLPATFRTA